MAVRNPVSRGVHRPQVPSGVAQGEVQVAVSPRGDGPVDLAVVVADEEALRPAVHGRVQHQHIVAQRHLPLQQQRLAVRMQLLKATGNTANLNSIRGIPELAALRAN